MDMEEKIKVLVVDDAAFMRRAVAEILTSDPRVEVIDTARDGLDGLQKIKHLRPDVITLDIDMPRMDGLAAIRHIMIESPVPIVVLSSLAHDGAITFEALRLGVVDFVPKPSGAISADIGKARNQLIDRIKMASSVNLENIRRVRLNPCHPSDCLSARYGFRSLDYLLTVGTTLSGPNTIIRLVSQLAPDLPAAIVAVQEISPNILPAFVQKFDEHVPWKVCMAQDGMLLEPGTCYVNSSEKSLSFGLDAVGRHVIKLDKSIPQPLNLLFSSAAEAFNQLAIGILLSGLGQDGADGLARIREARGVAIAQNTETCVYPNLTEHAIRRGAVDAVLSEADIPQAVCSLMA
jgi:two-component system chemotaxis response regulator CheB